MDEHMVLVLAIQLVALFGIAGALLLYLLCKIRPSGNCETGTHHGLSTGKAVLVTSVDTAIGLQMALHLANRGFRVFAGLKSFSEHHSDESVPCRVIRAWQKQRESLQITMPGALVTLPLDVTREDLLHEAVDTIRAHLPAGEDGLWAVINSSVVSYRGRFEQQDMSHWDAMLKTNLIGLLRTTRTFLGLLRKTRGRILTLGNPQRCEAQLVAYTASRYAVEGASNALRHELTPVGVHVVVLHASGIPTEALCLPPRMNLRTEHTHQDIMVEVGDGGIPYQPQILSKQALRALEAAITAENPKHNYDLTQFNWFNPFTF